MKVLALPVCLDRLIKHLTWWVPPTRILSKVPQFGLLLLWMSLTPSALWAPFTRSLIPRCLQWRDTFLQEALGWNMTHSCTIVYVYWCLEHLDTIRWSPVIMQASALKFRFMYHWIKMGFYHTQSLAVNEYLHLEMNRASLVAFWEWNLGTLMTCLNLFHCGAVYAMFEFMGCVRMNSNKLYVLVGQNTTYINAVCTILKPACQVKQLN